MLLPQNQKTDLSENAVANDLNSAENKFQMTTINPNTI